MMWLQTRKGGGQRPVDLTGVFKGRAAILMGGAPSIKEQNLRLLEQRGVLTMAINNAAIHFRPSLWIGCDHPGCFEPQILLDPTIMKFAPLPYADVKFGDTHYRDVPNIYFFPYESHVPWEDFLEQRRAAPWYNNTLMTAIHALYQMGVTTIILGGSDFGGSGERMYAHETDLGDLQKKWNQKLYDNLASELRTLKPYFEKMNLKFYDCSAHSRLSQTYKHLTLEEAVSMCLEKFPKAQVDPKTLPHCSAFAPDRIKELVAKSD